MAIGDDPLKKAMRDLTGASDIVKAAAGLGRHSDIIERALTAQRQHDELMRLRPDVFAETAAGRDRISRLLDARPNLFAEMAAGHQRIADMLAKRPGIVEEMARRQSEFDTFVASGAFAQASTRISAFEEALAATERLGKLLPKADVYQRMLGARPLIPDSVADVLARSGALTPTLERLGAATSLDRAVVEQLAGIEQLVAGTNAARLSRVSLAERFPDLVPRYRVPTAAEITDIDLAGAAGIGDPAGEWARATAAQMAAIERPWVRTDQPELSIEGYAAFKGVTEVVARTAPAAPRATQLVRAELGDYRREDEADEAVGDPMLAGGLRIARGFDLRLASLPMALVGHIFVPFGMAPGAPPEADPDELDAAIALMFRQLERKLRAFIDRSMKAGVGERWIRQRVHKTIREEWERRKQADIDAGRTPGELFDYADFGDYRAIIEHGENWRDVFQAIFKVKTAIGETLSRLGVIRNPVAHVRPLTVEDLLTLRVEGRRLYVWMGEAVP